MSRRKVHFSPHTCGASAHVPVFKKEYDQLFGWVWCRMTSGLFTTRPDEVTCKRCLEGIRAMHCMSRESGREDFDFYNVTRQGFWCCCASKGAPHPRGQEELQIEVLYELKRAAAMKGLMLRPERVELALHLMSPEVAASLRDAISSLRVLVESVRQSEKRAAELEHRFEHAAEEWTDVYVCRLVERGRVAA